MSLNFFWNFGRDLLAKFSNKSSPQKLYPWRLNSTNKSLLKFEKKLRCLGYNFWGNFLGYKNPGIPGGIFMSKKKLSLGFRFRFARENTEVFRAKRRTPKAKRSLGNWVGKEKNSMAMTDRPTDDQFWCVLFGMTSMQPCRIRFYSIFFFLKRSKV